MTNIKSASGGLFHLHPDHRSTHLSPPRCDHLHQLLHLLQGDDDDTVEDDDDDENDDYASYFLPIVVTFSINSCISCKAVFNIAVIIDLEQDCLKHHNIIFRRIHYSRWFLSFICSYSGGTLRVLAALAVVSRGELVLRT